VAESRNTTSLSVSLLLGWHNHINDCFEVLGALNDAPDDVSTSSSSALAAG
jgi:hypothetical protein